MALKSRNKYKQYNNDYETTNSSCSYYETHIGTQFITLIGKKQTRG